MLNTCQDKTKSSQQDATKS